MLRNKLYLYGDEDVMIPGCLHFGKFMLNRLKKYEDHVAIINAATDERVTYRQLAQRTVDVALSLVHAGVRKGDVVATCSGNEEDFMAVVYGTLAIGATYSPLDVSCEKASFLHRFNIAKPKFLFCSRSGYNKHKDAFKTVTFVERIIIFGEAIDDAMGFDEFLTQHASVEDFDTVPVNAAEDLALIVFSSGTSGMPKGIQQTHVGMMFYTQDNCEGSEVICPGSRTLGFFEWYNTYGLVLSFYIHQLGSTYVYYSNSDARTTFDIIQRYQINIIQATPTTLVQLMKVTDSSQYDTSSVRIVAVAGTICEEKLLLDFKERVPSAHTVIQHYGMTEAGSVCHPTYRPNGARPASIGGVRSLVILKIVDVETRKLLGPHQRGEICIKSPGLMKGYIGESVDHLDEEGFYKSGDIGYYDENKHLYVVDRIKDLIKYNNYHVVPAELEAVITQHPAVAEAAVVGARSEQFHELPAAFVVLQPGARLLEEELVAFVDRHVSPNMRLAGGARFVDALPRCSGIKIDRKKLKQMLNEN